MIETLEDVCLLLLVFGLYGIGLWAELTLCMMHYDKQLKKMRQKYKRGGK